MSQNPSHSWPTRPPPPSSHQLLLNARCLINARWLSGGQGLLASGTELWGGGHWWGFPWEDQQVAEHPFAHSLEPASSAASKSEALKRRTVCRIDGSWGGFSSASTDLLTHTQTRWLCACVCVVISLSKWGYKGNDSWIHQRTQTHKQGKSLCIWLTFFCTNTHANTESPVHRPSSASPFVLGTDN